MTKTKSMKLKILVPEDLNYEDVFDEILNEDVSQKKFIDELRCKNGNLNIALTSAGLEEKVYV